MDYCSCFVLCSKSQACSTKILLPAINISTVNIFQRKQKGFFFLCSSTTLIVKNVFQVLLMDVWLVSTPKLKKVLTDPSLSSWIKAALALAVTLFHHSQASCRKKWPTCLICCEAETVASSLKHYLSWRTIRFQIHSVIWIFLISLTPAIWTVWTRQNALSWFWQ